MLFTCPKCEKEMDIAPSADKCIHCGAQININKKIFHCNFCGNVMLGDKDKNSLICSFCKREIRKSS